MEYPDYVKEGVNWLIARRDSAHRSTHGNADEEESLLKYICELRADLKQSQSALAAREQQGYLKGLDRAADYVADNMPMPKNLDKFEEHLKNIRALAEDKEGR